MGKIYSKLGDIEQCPQGSIITIEFSGFYPPASEGNPHAKEMGKFVAKIITDHNPAGVLFDLRGLDYRAGDAIGTIIIPLLEDNKVFKPSAFVASGKTAESLQWFFTPDVIFSIARSKLFDNIASALEYVKGRLEETQP
jgi:hypothetical protein